MKFSIRLKIMLCVLVTVAVAFLACGIGGYAYFYRVLEEHTVLEEEQKLTQTADQVEYIQNNIISIGKQIVVDNSIQQCLREGEKEDVVDNLIEEAAVKEVLRKYINQQPYIYGVTLLARDGRSFSSNSTEDGDLILKEKWYQDFKSSERQRGFSDSYMYTVEKGAAKMEAVSYIMSFKDLSNGKDTLGDMIIHVGCQYLRGYTKLDSVLLKGYALYDAYGNSLAGEGRLSLGYEDIRKLEQRKVSLDNQNTLLLNRDMEDSWILVSEVSNELLGEQLVYVGYFFLGVFLLAALILVCVLFLLIRSITRPIEQLHQAAAEVGKGNLDVAVKIRTNDELQILGEAFNSMTADIQKRMKESIEYEKATKEMEINRLMLQINPHFIYNTLNSIVYMARIQGNEDIVRFSKAFISLLQDTLKVRKDTIFISMAQEMKNVKNYLLLQEYRYANRFEVSYQVEEETLKAAVPNVMIQPIVENAVFHGLAGKMEKGHLWIQIEKIQNTVRITIRDDGLGMQPETVKRILSEEDPIKGEMRTIGVGNVIQRIHHIYGKEYGMDIHSKPGEGTEVVIVIPYLLYEEGAEKE